ncbi:hypothetical protein [Rhodococcus rhodochrous]|uniref:hypothetical protein n=1 Tax=Rhodococcus rhodochrous TaxID=1829 RepID=UPI00177E3E6B|nr:hypothetical protein [Rhodococcus rhodochrous]QOH56225.1 hypothetical protein C6Y44_09815 [Rhodococcus rhodochrous]
MTYTWEEAAQKLDDLQPFIQYCIDTDEAEWQVDTVRSSGNTKNCLFGHLINWAYGKDYEGSVSAIWDMFEEIWGTTYLVYEINDGRHPAYPQETPRQRCIAYLKDLWLGRIEDTQTGWAKEAERHGVAS